MPIIWTFNCILGCIHYPQSKYSALFKPNGHAGSVNAMPHICLDFFQPCASLFHQLALGATRHAYGHKMGVHGPWALLRTRGAPKWPKLKKVRGMSLSTIRKKPIEPDQTLFGKSNLVQKKFIPNVVNKHIVQWGSAEIACKASSKSQIGQKKLILFVRRTSLEFSTLLFQWCSCYIIIPSEWSLVNLGL